MGIQTNADRADPGNQSIVTAASMLVTGLIAGATGENVQGAAAAAQNEALNNYLSKKQEADKAAADQNCGSNCDQVDAAFKSLSDANNAALASCLAKGSCRRTG
ncbi:hypothetical protein A8H39_32950 [Paraburkholderia fungorum]|uniref:VENN motif pre-toxin domain-containing protein n=1 Tax=Paraburkholderia fungorum TaxID=134537 RepID=UPI0000322878|nr:VENN motif pre-toxin domain-containing protein [Paraburkholderia fungorum]PNE53414.1 hypothetical protein A8H39_32950 [Paraburkholderia fungorum]